MKAINLWIRITPFLLALVLGLLNRTVDPVSSQPQGQGGLQWYAMPDSALGGAPLSPTGAGHIDSQGIFKCPAVGPCIYPVSDKILFTQDRFGGLGIIVSGAAVHDGWTWSYYFPGNPPQQGVPDLTCWMEIYPPGEPPNTTGFVALVSNCNPTGVLEVVKTFPSGCPCSFSGVAVALIAGWPAEYELGTWTAIVDYTDHSGEPIPAVAQDNMYLMHTPAVVLIHGYMGDCDGLATLEQNIEQELAVSDDRVTCYEYDSRKGVATPAGELERFVAGFRQDLGMGLGEEVDLVGHSMGGLVARYYAQRPLCLQIGSVSMLGTPNEGVQAINWEEFTCPAVGLASAVAGGGPLGFLGGVGLGILTTATCDVVDIADWEDDLFGYDPDSQGIDDMKPDSTVLKLLNIGFVPPEPPELPDYRAHAGLHSTVGGGVISGYPNDCVVSLDSVDGPEIGDQAVFGDPRLFRYPPLTHGASAPGCDPPTLTDDMSVVEDLAVTIKGNPTGGALAPEPPAEQEDDGPELDQALLKVMIDYVHPSQVNTHHLTVPGGLANTAFVVHWPDAGDPPPNLGITLRRPNGQLVAPSDPDVVADLSSAGTGFLDTLLGGFVMSAPQAGDWEVAVEGVSVPEEGLAYLIAVTPDSQVVLTTATAEPDLAEGQPQVITATLFDGGTPIAPTSISAQVGTPAVTAEDVVLLDDGVGEDETAGDLTYSGTFTATADCGRYGILAIATGDSSEGTVTREQIDVFQVQAPGDAVRQPCNPDDDEDLFTDDDELNYLGTDPLDNCPDNTSDAAWPLDQNNDRVITITDVTRYTGKLFTSVTCPSADPDCRLDLDTNGMILILDVFQYTGRLFATCT